MLLLRENVGPGKPGRSRGLEGALLGSVSRTASAWAWDTRRSGFSATPSLVNRNTPPPDGIPNPRAIVVLQRGPVAGVGEHQVEPAIAVDVHSVDRATAVDIQRTAGPARFAHACPEPRGNCLHASAAENSPLTNGEEPCSVSNS